jgi:Sec-independent protein translocase protein TatA
MGGDLGAAVKGFRKGMGDVRGDDEEKLEPDQIAAEQKSESATAEPAKNKESTS